MGRDVILNGKEWHGLHPGSRDIYLLLKSKFNGVNNGQILLHYSEIMAKGVKGLQSHSVISRAFSELEVSGWIERTKIGGLFRFKNSYRLTGRFDSLLG
jgi:hypothetical protein